MAFGNDFTPFSGDEESFIRKLNAEVPYLIFESEAYTYLLAAILSLPFADKDKYHFIGNVMHLINNYDDPQKRVVAYLYNLLPFHDPDDLTTMTHDDYSRVVLSILLSIKGKDVHETAEILKDRPDITEVVISCIKFHLQNLLTDVINSPVDKDKLVRVLVYKEQIDTLSSVLNQAPRPEIPAIDEDVLDGTESPEGLAFQPNI